jgi:hypothetical protein
VADIKIQNYQVRRNGRGFWEPTPRMRELGFRSIACGPDGPDAWAIARQWQARWEAARKGRTPCPAMLSAENLSPDQAEELTIYPRGSVGEGFRRFRKTEEWKNKKLRTREDWWRVYRQIKPVFGDCDPKTVTLENLDAWRAMIEQTVSLREAHRCIKIWRAMWRKLAALGYCVRDADPSLGIINRAAKGRSAVWSEGEVVRLYKRAWRERYYGLGNRGVVVNSAKPRRCAHAGGLAVGHRRRRSGFLHRPLAAIEASVKALGAELHGDAPIFRNRSGAPYSSDTLGDDFRDIRHMEFGAEESRTLADFRRSGTQEAFAGDANPADVSHAMGNTIGTSNMLFATYNPVNIASVRKVHEAGIKGRQRLREMGRNVRQALNRPV